MESGRARKPGSRQAFDAARRASPACRRGCHMWTAAVDAVWARPSTASFWVIFGHESGLFNRLRRHWVQTLLSSLGFSGEPSSIHADECDHIVVLNISKQFAAWLSLAHGMSGLGSARSVR